MPFDFFLFLTILTAIVVLVSILMAYRRSRDSFHPMIYMGLMLFYLYSYLPLSLFFQDADRLQTFLSVRQLEYIQGLNLLGVISICVGILIGDKGLRWSKLSKPKWVLPPIVEQRINRAAIACGFIGVIAFAVGIINVGGIEAAYGGGYGGGWDDSGYIREAPLLTLPAMLWFMTSHMRRKLTRFEWGLVFLFAIPQLMHGLLGARRGPTAMILVAIVMGWYLIRFRRPPLPIVVTGSVLLGLLLLFLVSNRGNIYLGSEFNFEGTQSYATEVGSSNEFIYGGGVILNTDKKDIYLWGRRYFTIFFIRPIPRALWPSKYEDASTILAIPNLEKNLGTGTDTFSETLGWAGAVGAAPGIVADMWIEFWWYYCIVLFIIGWFYGMAWRKAVSKGGLWIPVYTLMTSLSVYLVMQTLEAMSFRFLLTATASWLIWRYGISGKRKRINSYAHNFANRNTRH